MRWKRSAATGLAAVISALAAGAASGQGRPPDLQGLWTNGWLTQLERPPSFSALVIPEDQARAFEAAHNGAPGIPGDVIGQADTEWWDLGGSLARIDGRARSSWVVDPEDGQLPYTPEGRRRLQASQRALGSAFEGPEARPAPERCLMALAGTNAPPMLNGPYNNHLQIVQTPGYVVIVTEMNHDVRIIPLGRRERPPGPSWLGHSVGRWDGDTLVVETTGFHPGGAWRMPTSLYISPDARVTERFRRVSQDEIRYAFEVDDPVIYSRPWRAEMPLRRARGPMYEFACHEGNYSLSGVLAGGRASEGPAQASTSP